MTDLTHTSQVTFIYKALLTGLFQSSFTVIKEMTVTDCLGFTAALIKLLSS